MFSFDGKKLSGTQDHPTGHDDPPKSKKVLGPLLATIVL